MSAEEFDTVCDDCGTLFELLEDSDVACPACSSMATRALSSKFRDGYVSREDLGVAMRLASRPVRNGRPTAPGRFPPPIPAKYKGSPTVPSEYLEGGPMFYRPGTRVPPPPLVLPNRPLTAAEVAEMNSDSRVFTQNGVKIDTNILEVAAVKHDDGKLRYDLMPHDALAEVVKVFTFGANKYADRNWEKGMGWGRLIRAATGHLFEWARGNDRDTESGCSHLAHAGCCVLMLLSYELRTVGTDDRSCH